MVNFPAWIPDCDSHSPILLGLFLCSDAGICSKMAFPPLGNSDHIVVSVSIDFQSNSQRDATFHHIAYDYSCVDLDWLHDHLKDVPWLDIFKLSASADASEFCEWVKVGTVVWAKSKMNPFLFQNDFALYFELYWKQENVIDINFLVLH